MERVPAPATEPPANTAQYSAADVAAALGPFGALRAAADAAAAPRAAIVAANEQARLAAQQRRTARIAELRSRLALNQKEAAELLGISDEGFLAVRPYLRCLDELGRAGMYTVASIEHYVTEHAREVTVNGRR